MIINGEAAAYRTSGTQKIDDGSPGRDCTVLLETLPGDAQPHRILDSGPSYYDDFPESLIPAGHYFLMGDNRDNSLDSRAPPGDLAGGMGASGMGMVSADRISRRIAPQ